MTQISIVEKQLMLQKDVINETLEHSTVCTVLKNFKLGPPPVSCFSCLGSCFFSLFFPIFKLSQYIIYPDQHYITVFEV